MINTIETTRKFARINANILIEGESGTGKELFAQAIHQESRPDGPFMALNCAAIPKNLIESELFGYEGGTFTGAERQGRPGKIELADGGTLFLDEIGDMPLELQPVLLRVLEEKKIMRVGGSKYISIDFNLVTATNKDLPKLMQNNAFREDLYYRLAVFKASLPPLRERGLDIVRLARYFIDTVATNQRIPAPSLSEEASHILAQYNWPGNVRQLENAMIYAVNMSVNGIIQPDDLPAEIKGLAVVQNKIVPMELATKPINIETAHDLSFKEMEKIAIIQALYKTGNNVSRASKLLGFSKSTIYRRIRDYNINVFAN
jgi:transcriptional regulator with PAS, ATPase and Fis domain